MTCDREPRARLDLSLDSNSARFTRRSSMYKKRSVEVFFSFYIGHPRLLKSAPYSITKSVCCPMCDARHAGYADKVDAEAVAFVVRNIMPKMCAAC